MKILYHHRIRSKDGQCVHIEELVYALQQLGHEVIISGPQILESAEFGSDAGFVAWLKKHIPQFLYEVLEFAYNLRDFWQLYRAAKKHKPDCLYERYNLYTIGGIFVKHLCKLPMLLEVNAPIYRERKKHDGIALNWLAKWTENFVWRKADVVLPVTNVLADIMVADGTPREKITVIHNGINPQRFSSQYSRQQAKEKLNISGKTVLGFVGFIRDWHGLEKIVDLVCDQDSDNVHLLVVGDGPARKTIEQKADTEGAADKITFTGVVTRDDLADYIAAFDVALQPDVVAYASPLKMFEYMYMECAIVAPETDNIKEILQHNHNALLFEPKNYQALRDAVSRLITDDALRESLSTSAKRTIQDKGFLWSSNATRVVNMFDELIADRAVSEPESNV